MDNLIERLKAAKLPESMGVEWITDGFYCVDQTLSPLTRKDRPQHPVRRIIDFDNDDCPGSALFIVRGLTALRDAGLAVGLDSFVAEWTVGEWSDDDITFDNIATAPTMTKAVGETLASVYGEKG